MGWLVVQAIIVLYYAVAILNKEVNYAGDLWC